MQSVAIIGKKNYFSASHTILSLLANRSNESPIFNYYTSVAGKHPGTSSGTIVPSVCQCLRYYIVL